jgi:hypothetical protein
MRSAEGFADSHLHTRITNVAFEREAAFKEAARTADDPPYTATATLWKVEETASNV